MRRPSPLSFLGAAALALSAGMHVGQSHQNQPATDDVVVRGRKRQTTRRYRFMPREPENMGVDPKILTRNAEESRQERMKESERDQARKREERAMAYIAGLVNYHPHHENPPTWAAAALRRLSLAQA